MDSFDFQFLLVISLGGFLGGIFLFWINNIDNDIIPPFHYDPSRDSPSPSQCSSKRPRNSLAGNAQKCQASSESSTSARNDPLERDAFMIPSKPYRNIENIAARYRAAAYSSDPFAHGLLPSASSPKSFLHNAPPVPPLFQYILSALIVVVIWEFLRYCLKSLKSRCTTCHVSHKCRPTKEKQIDTPEVTQSVVDSPLALTTMPKHRRLVFEPRQVDIPPSPTEILSRRQSAVRRTSIRSDSSDSGYQTARSRLNSSLSTQSAATNSPFRSFPCITPPSPLRLKLKTKASSLPKDVFTVTTYNTHTTSVDNSTPRDTANASAKSIDPNDISAEVLNKSENENENASIKIGPTHTNNEVVDNTTPINPDETFLVENSRAYTPRKEPNSCVSPNITPTPATPHQNIVPMPFKFRSSAKKITLSQTPSLSPATPLRATTGMLSSLSNSLDEKTIIPNALSPATPLHSTTALANYFDLSEKKTPTLNNTQSPKMLTPLPPFVVARKRRKLDIRRSSNESPPSSSPPSSPPSPSSPTSSPPVTHDQSPESSRLRPVLSPHPMTSPSPSSSLTSSPRLESLPSIISPNRITSLLATKLDLFDSPNNRFTPIERTVLHDRHMNPSLLNEASLSLIPSRSSSVQSLDDSGSNETSPLPILPSVTRKPEKFTVYTGNEEKGGGGEEQSEPWQQSPPPASLPVLPPRPKFSIYTGSDPSGASSSSSNSSSSYSDDSSTRPLPGTDLQTLNENLLRRIKRIDRIRAKARLPDQNDENEEPRGEKPGPVDDDAGSDGIERHSTHEQIMVAKENLMKRISMMAEERRRRRVGFTPLAEVQKEEESLRSSDGSSILSNRPGRRVRFAESKNTIHVFEAVKADNTAYTPTLWALSRHSKTFYDEESGDEYTRELTREELIECEELDTSIRLELDDLRREMAEKGTVVFLRHHLGCTDLGLSPDKSGRVDFSFEADDDEPVEEVSGVDLECCYEEEEEGLNS